MALVERQGFRLKTRSKSRWLFVVFVSVLIVGALMLFFDRGREIHVSLRSSSIKTGQEVFSLLVTAQFDSAEHKGEFLKEFKHVANHVRSLEPTTLAYEALLSDKDPLQVMILERYTDKEDAYLKIHKSSGPFLKFREKLQTMQDNGYVKLSGNSYLDSGIGFGGR